MLQSPRRSKVFKLWQVYNQLEGRSKAVCYHRLWIQEIPTRYLKFLLKVSIVSGGMGWGRWSSVKTSFTSREIPKITGIDSSQDGLHEVSSHRTALWEPSLSTSFLSMPSQHLDSLSNKGTNGFCCTSSFVESLLPSALILVPVIPSICILLYPTHT